ncbi:putative membrane protein [Desulfobaculum xiamenense]|uniref:Putative membrane protein n=1 Tax=Desulfobaculum xiamenense TaxID=995050 RepID=A0A846QI81_9BACT|nr:LapA family protein [Desulfobaculum xiamenense]NJB66810.1 putative membrane protein [Desulfobaculum xiamenense]
MRYLKVLALLALFFLTMVLFAQNMEALSQQVELGLVLFGQELFLIHQPIYFILLSAFVLGGALCTLYFLYEKIRVSSELRSCRKKLRNLEKEVNSLRSLPLEDKNFPVEPMPAVEADVQEGK